MLDASPIRPQFQGTDSTRLQDLRPRKSPRRLIPPRGREFEPLASGGSQRLSSQPAGRGDSLCTTIRQEGDVLFFGPRQRRMPSADRIRQAERRRIPIRRPSLGQGSVPANKCPIKFRVPENTAICWRRPRPMASARRTSQASTMHAAKTTGITRFIQFLRTRDSRKA